MKIEASGIQAGYGSRIVLRDVSFAASGAETVVLLGPNGSGKSTLLKVLAGRLAPRAGEVLLDGLPLASLPRRTIAKKLAVLPQEFHLPPEMTVRELVLLGRYPYRGSFLPPNREDRRILDAALEQMNLTELRNRRLGTLSGGERRRARIAMTLAQSPGILLLDEPTAFLDIPSQVSFSEQLVRMRADFGITVIVVLHDLNLAARCASRIVLMREGRILYSGSPRDVLTEESIQAVFGVRMEVRTTPGGSLCCLPCGPSAG